MPKTLKGSDAVAAFRNSSKGQVVLVLQGGGALGAYQVGVYQALHEAGIKLDWIIGTSIGAINAGLIAGNTPERRVDALQEFWRRMRSEEVWHYLPAWTGLPDVTSYLTTLFGGISSFFRPNAAAFLGPHIRLGAESAGFYSTTPLRKTISELVDFSLINRSSSRCDRRRLACADRHHAVFRQSRSSDHRRPHPGLWRAAAGVSGSAHKRRILLGWRYPVQFADRSDLRR